MSSFVPPGIAALAGLYKPGASWKDRLREAAYTSPSGKRIVFQYEAVAREVTKRSSAFEFPGVKDAYVQQNGFGARRYPMLCFFSGKEHDLVATAFERALLEDGIGKLQHPLYGMFDVTPFGDIARREDLVTEANQSVVEVTFWTTIGSIYPSASKSGPNELDNAVSVYDLAAGSQFAGAMQLADTVSKANLKATIRKALRTIQSTLQAASDATESVNREFRDITSLINFGIDVLVGQPLDLARQISNLIKAPGRALAGIEDRLAGYEALAQRIFASPAGRPGDALVSGVSIPLRTRKAANDFHTSDLIATNAVMGSIVSVRNNTFSTKTEALSAAERIIAQFDAAVAWRDGGFSALSAVAKVGAYQQDTGESYQALQAAVATAVGFIVQASFSLQPEKAIVLGRARTIIDLCAELYGTTGDDALNLLINSNDLTGSEIIELQRGRRIKYYPAAA